MLPPDLQGLATRRLAYLPGRDSHPLDYATLPGRTIELSGFVARELSGFSVRKKGPFYEQEVSGGRSLSSPFIPC